MSNVRYALRQLLRRPVFSAVVIGMLAVGIGATTAMFSWVHTVLLQPLPVTAPERLVNLGAPGPKPGSNSCSFAGDCEQVFSYPMFRDLEAQQSVFTGIAGHRFFRANLSFEDRTQAGAGALVSGSYFSVLGLTPAVGRLIAPADEPRVGESAVVVLSHDYWQNAFGGAPDVIGRTLLVNGEDLAIIGVAPEGFSGTTIGAQPQIFVPLTMRWLMEPTITNTPEDRLAYWIYVFARLRPGVTIDQARANVNVLYNGILNEVEVPLNDFLPPDVLERFSERQITVEPGLRGQSNIPQNSGRPLTLLFGITAVVLLIVCVNIANLLLARGASRSGELAIRGSLGASRMHLLSQSLTEAAILALVGGLCSLPLAAFILAAIQALIPITEVGFGLDVELSTATFAFTAAVTVATVLLFGLLPALKATRTDPGIIVKGQAAQAGSSHTANRFRNSLATVQIAFSTLLLALAGLFIQSLANIARVDLGMDLDSVVSFGVSPRLNGYSAERAMNVFDRLEETLAAEPGVVGVTTARVAMIANNNSRNSLTVEGYDAEPADDAASTNDVGPSFFRILGIPILAGRDFDRSDAIGRPRVAVVNQAFLRKFGLGMDAIGKRFAEGQGEGTELDIEIIGIAADAKYSTVKDAVPPQYFLPRQQNDNIGTLTFYVRGAVDADTLFGTIRRAAAMVDPNLPVANLATMERIVDDNVFLDRIVAIFSTAFAALATLLAAVGLYGVLAYNVVERTRELGVRLALGATPSRLRAMILSQVGRMALIGIPVGLIAAVFAGRSAAALLFGLSGSDPGILTATVAALVCVVAAAGWLPAGRAARIAPMAALRYE